jgi:lipoprotein-releasing system ATP-binding protein
MSKNTKRSSARHSSAVAAASLAAAGTAARGTRPDARSPANAAGDQAPSTAKGPHFLAADQRSEQSVQLQALNLWKSYRKAAVEVPVLRGVSFRVRPGELLAIVGQSGSGKSTLLHLLGTLDAPDKGEVHYAGQRIDDLPARARDHLRNHRFGMIFQFYHLLPELTTLENVLSPLMIAQGAWSYFRDRRQHRARAEELLEMVGLSHRLKHRPRELSGGEMQRAAIARALIAQPDLLLADEPTGNLDQATGQEIIRLLRTLNRQQNLTIVMVTHDRAIADQADRIVRLAGGRIDD